METQFLSTLSLRRATLRRNASYNYRNISIHALLAESDPFLRSVPMMRRYFYPRSLCGERPRDASKRPEMSHFYPRSPCGERPALNQPVTIGNIFLSTLSLRRATRGPRCYPPRSHISIHALLAESDVNTADQEARKRLISIHALLAESDGPGLARLASRLDFYPRSPCGERRKKSPPMCSIRHFYPRSPCGERQTT